MREDVDFMKRSPACRKRWLRQSRQDHAGATVWRAPMLRARTSISRTDSVLDGKSYYLAEAESVRTLVRATGGVGSISSSSMRPSAGPTRPNVWRLHDRRRRNADSLRPQHHCRVHLRRATGGQATGYNHNAQQCERGTRNDAWISRVAADEVVLLEVHRCSEEGQRECISEDAGDCTSGKYASAQRSSVLHAAARRPRVWLP